LQRTLLMQLASTDALDDIDYSVKESFDLIDVGEAEDLEEEDSLDIEMPIKGIIANIREITDGDITGREIAEIADCSEGYAAKVIGDIETDEFDPRERQKYLDEEVQATLEEHMREKKVGLHRTPEDTGFISEVAEANDLPSEGIDGYVSRDAIAGRLLELDEEEALEIISETIASESKKKAIVNAHLSPSSVSPGRVADVTDAAKSLVRRYRRHIENDPRTESSAFTKAELAEVQDEDVMAGFTLLGDIDAVPGLQGAYPAPEAVDEDDPLLNPEMATPDMGEADSDAPHRSRFHEELLISEDEVDRFRDEMAHSAPEALLYNAQKNSEKKVIILNALLAPAEIPKELVIEFADATEGYVNSMIAGLRNGEIDAAVVDSALSARLTAALVELATRKLDGDEESPETAELESGDVEDHASAEIEADA